MKRWPDLAVALLALAAIVVALANLRATTRGLRIDRVTLEQTPVTVYRPAAGPRAPVILIAHGFAGSQQLMQPFAVTFARNGYTAMTFDFPGHGRNPTPLTGSIINENGATRVLVAEMAHVAAFARTLGDGRLAVLGHSMASDIVVRFARSQPNVAATIAVSMFSPAVVPSGPRDLLVIVGDWEGALKREALRAVGQISPGPPRELVTYGDTAAGTARRAAFSAGVEHIGVLYSPHSMDEALAWADAVFGHPPRAVRYLDERGPWILLLLAGLVALGRPLAPLLPVVSRVPTGAGLGWRSIWPSMIIPMIATPLLLRVLPTHFLPVLVGDYLAAHFLAYGLITAACLRWLAPRHARGHLPRLPALAFAALAVIAYGAIGLGWAIDTHITSFVATPSRLPLIAAMLAGTLAYFLADEWLTRGPGAARGAYFVSKLAFLVSLGIAVGLDFERLFFLLIIVPVIVFVLLIYGLFSTWSYRRTGSPLVAGTGSAVAFAWAIGVTFPLLAA